MTGLEEQEKLLFLALQGILPELVSRYRCANHRVKP